MWRKFPARVHTGAGVELEIFRRAGSLRGVICGAKTRDDFPVNGKLYRSQHNHLNLKPWLPYATEDDVSLVSEALLGLA
jgi:hypothetical protein